MAAILKHWREAASLIIIAPSRLQTAATFLNPDYETLLLQRSSKSKFMPNKYVFPGGVAVNNDFSPEWTSVFRRVGIDFQKAVFEKVSKGSSKAPPLITRNRDPQFSEIPPDVAFRICAIRETFEESGILIVKHVKELKNEQFSEMEQWKSCSNLPDVSLEIDEWRKQVNENPDNFLKMCQEMDLVPDILALYEWTNWLTPAVVPGRRFDTIFYICCLNEIPKTKEDSVETVNYKWVSPSSLLSAYYTDHSVALAPPQIYELSRLMHFTKVQDLMKFSADREHERVELYFPVIVITKDFWLSVLPGDDLYPKNPDLYTPKRVIYHNEAMQEVNKNVKNFHRCIWSTSDKKQTTLMISNKVFDNKHVGPVQGLHKTLVSNGTMSNL